MIHVYAYEDLETGIRMFIKHSTKFRFDCKIGVSIRTLKVHWAGDWVQKRPLRGCFWHSSVQGRRYVANGQFLTGFQAKSTIKKPQSRKKTQSFLGRLYSAHKLFSTFKASSNWFGYHLAHRVLGEILTPKIQEWWRSWFFNQNGLLESCTMSKIVQFWGSLTSILQCFVITSLIKLSV